MAGTAGKRGRVNKGAGRWVSRKNDFSALIVSVNQGSSDRDRLLEILNGREPPRLSAMRLRAGCHFKKSCKRFKARKQQGEPCSIFPSRFASFAMSGVCEGYSGSPLCGFRASSSTMKLTNALSSKGWTPTLGSVTAGPREAATASHSSISGSVSLFH